MKEIKITKNDVNSRLDNFLAKMFINLKKPEIYKLIRKKKILVNNTKIDFNYRLKENDKIFILVDLEINKKINKSLNWMNAKPQLKVVYEDNNIIIVNKDIGISVYDEKQIEPDTLINRIIKYLYNKKEYDYQNENSFVPALAHRLDTNTSGLMIAAKNKQALVELNTIFADKLIEKKYLALVYGIVNKEQATINCWIKKNEDDNFVSISFDKKDANYKEAITKYKLLETIKNKYSLVDINLITGRTHQIRATFNLINHPLVGEQKYITKYIDKDNRFKYQCLCSYKLRFKEINTNLLKYLSNKEFNLKDDIWFINKLNEK